MYEQGMGRGVKTAKIWIPFLWMINYREGFWLY
jgi:hypothetical protein